MDVLGFWLKRTPGCRGGWLTVPVEVVEMVELERGEMMKVRIQVDDLERYQILPVIYLERNLAPKPARAEFFRC